MVENNVNLAAQNSALLSALDHQRNSSGSSSGGSAAAEGLELGDAITQGANKAIQTFVCKILGLQINPDIEGKSAVAGFETQNVGSGFSLANGALIRPESGGGWLSMLWDVVKRHFTRDVPSGGDAASGGGDAFAGGGGGFADSGGGGSGSAMASGGGDLSGPSGVGTSDMPDVQINYGGRTMQADMLIADLGNLKPTATPASSGSDRDGGMVM